MLNPSGLSFIDGADLWTVYGMFIEKGTADFLRYAPKKDSITHDWMDANGIDVDLSRIFFSQREVNLSCAIITSDEDEFWAKHKAFVALMTQPGLRRLEITSHGQRSYFVYYKECNNYSQAIPLRGSTDPGMIAHKFNIVIVEPSPSTDNGDVFIVDEDGRFLIT
jgi:hypothetical protein